MGSNSASISRNMFEKRKIKITLLTEKNIFKQNILLHSINLQKKYL